MADLVTWRGSSGTLYKYWSTEVGVKVKRVDGNYIFAKRNDHGGWDAVYVGQGDLSTRADVHEHYKGDQILLKGATHVHVRANSNLVARMQEWADLLMGHPEAYEPSGCNGNSRRAEEAAQVDGEQFRRLG
jgi:hypothetical protein